VEALNACLGDTVLAPELVSFGAVLCVAIGYHGSAISASNDEDFPHLVMWQFFLVPFDIRIARL
jgi:hypothetical protein